VADTLFDQINNLWTKEVQVTTKTKPESIYMICRFLSLSSDGFIAAMDLNQIKDCPEWAKLPFLFHSIPENSSPRNKYPKITKEKRTPRRQKAIDRLATKFCLKEFHALQVLSLLEKQGIQLEAD